MRHLLICSYLEPHLVDRIRAVSDDVEVDYRPDLIAPPRFPADHVGAPFRRDPEQADVWHDLMERAEIWFDFDHTDRGGIVSHASRLAWVQATSAGVGDFVRAYELGRLGAVITTAAGVHARPLAEFVLWAMLGFVKSYPRARRQQREHHWERFHGDDLAGKTLAIVGLGSVGREVARLARALGVRVLATKRDVAGVRPADVGVDALLPREELNVLLGQADFVCLVAPNTPHTSGMIGRDALEHIKPGAVLINIGRGALVDEPAMLRALEEGRLAGAVLDVAAVEPLPPEHPLWDMDNVIVFPHSASTSRHENERLTELFVDNLRRYLDGRPLRNVYDHDRQY